MTSRGCVKTGPRTKVGLVYTVLRRTGVAPSGEKFKQQGVYIIENIVTVIMRNEHSKKREI